MNVMEYTMKRKEAHKLWKDYVAAVKSNPRDKFLLDMKKVYNQLKSGRKIIDILKIFEISGVTDKFEPKLAITEASSEKVYCEYRENGSLHFKTRPFSWGLDRAKDSDVVLLNIFPKLPESQWTDKYNHHKRMEAVVPKIPASIRPKGKLNNYYVLWEVEQWKPVPPRDPFLLRRITNNMFVVVAGWQLTELERSVMRGRVY